MTADRPRHLPASWRLLAVLVSLGLAACGGTPPVSSGAFRNAGTIETQLKRGVSTKTDVQALLGVPNGPGSASFPTFDPDPREIWYYEDLSLGGSTLRMQMVFVFFKGNLYDGYLWTSGTGTTEIK